MPPVDPDLSTSGIKSQITVVNHFMTPLRTLLSGSGLSLFAGVNARMRVAGSRRNRSFMKLRVGTVCDRGLNPKRPVNQDRLLVLPRTGLFAVFDGVGGHRAGEVASQAAADTIREALSTANNAAPTELVTQAIGLANRDIFELAESDPAYKSMATTVALAYINGNRATIAHVGDSRVYRMEEGRLHRETIDHADGDDHVINRALGVEPEVEIETKSIPIREGSWLLLCTDGVYRNIPDDQIQSVLSQNRDPQTAADELKRIVYERGASDNLTAVVVQAQGETARASTRASRIEVALGRQGNELRQPAARSGRLRTVALVALALIAICGAFYAGMRLAAREARTVSESAEPLSSVDVLIKDGREAFERGDRGAATAAFTSAIAREPENSAGYYWLGRSQLEQDQYEAAASSFTRASELAPQLLDAYVHAAAAYQAAGNRKRASEMLARYVELRRQRQQ